MATELERMTAFIAARVIDTPGTFERVVGLGINFRDWPEHFLSREVLDSFEKNMGVSEQTAVWKAAQSLAPEKLSEIFGQIEYPSEPQALKHLYEKLIYREKVAGLSADLSRFPERAPDLVNNFLNYRGSSVEIIPFEEAIGLMAEAHQKQRAEGKQLVTIPNWPRLSDAVGGFNPGRLGILVADTGFGKTNLGVQLSIDASVSIPTLYLNMEVIRDDFTQRAVACMEYLKPKDFHGDWNVERAKLSAKQRKFFFSTGKDLSPAEIAACCRKYKTEHDVGIVIVDYDQKIVLSGADEEWRELQRASVGLERVAKDLGIYILLLAQSNLDGGISGSRRATFPASHVLLFEKNKEDETEVIIRAMKNRFGVRNAAVKVAYEPAVARVKEVEGFVWIQSKKQKKEFKKPAETTASHAYDC